MEDLKPNQQRAKIAITLIWLVFVVQTISLISSYLQYDLLQQASKGAMISPLVASANDLRETIIKSIFLILMLFSAITFIMWFRRAYFNLHLRVNPLSYSEGWAAGGWFIPVGNLFVPFQIMKELYGETKDLLLKKGYSEHQKLNTGLIGWWWTVWIITAIIGQVIYHYFKNITSIEEMITGTIFSMISQILYIPLALLAIQVIKRYSSVEPILHEIKEVEEELIPKEGIVVLGDEWNFES